jgi:hypothetical protein
LELLKKTDGTVALPHLQLFLEPARESKPSRSRTSRCLWSGTRYTQRAHRTPDISKDHAEVKIGKKKGKEKKKGDETEFL